jgi:hypothetical protein
MMSLQMMDDIHRITPKSPFLLLVPQQTVYYRAAIRCTRLLKRTGMVRGSRFHVGRAISEYGHVSTRDVRGDGMVYPSLLAYGSQPYCSTITASV